MANTSGFHFLYLLYIPNIIIIASAKKLKMYVKSMKQKEMENNVELLKPL